MSVSFKRELSAEAILVPGAERAKPALDEEQEAIGAKLINAAGRPSEGLVKVYDEINAWTIYF